MKNYLDLLQEILRDGTKQNNRTGVPAISLPGASLRFDLSQGFPLLTTKAVPVKAMIGELCAFIEGATSAARFRELGCKFWDQNANENAAWLANPNRKGEDDLGVIYGAQWRNWNGIDQLQRAVDTIRKDPTNRRIIVSAWNPSDFDKMALPPCHVSYQFIVNVERNELNLCMYQRSCDMFLGVPVNIASSALLLSLMAHITGLRPRFFTHFLADAHIYENHLDQVKLQLSRTPDDLPELWISSHIRELSDIAPDGISFLGYKPDESIKAQMAV